MAKAKLSNYGIPNMLGIKRSLGRVEYSWRPGPPAPPRFFRAGRPKSSAVDSHAPGKFDAHDEGPLRSTDRV